ncbi:hypothetical protein [Nevskia soli]|uniref:hypothetical protein n=1 Tax=Nevskia soli TaxID=418856 RepID=UPI0004A6BC11|nr:hypothetical protein [Nevskia soli]
MRILRFGACIVAVGVAFAACGQSSPGIPSPAALAKFQPREDGWQNDPANQPHPNDPNPLRRALGDGPIIHGLFGKPDLGEFTACVKQHAGLKTEGYEASYLAKCPALQQDLLGRAQAAGFTGVTADNVFDQHLLRLRR